MRICIKERRWKCMAWTGPNGEAGHSMWLPSERFVQDDVWCAWMDTAYPGWVHTVQENRDVPAEKSPEGWEEHPLFGNMERGPMGL